MYNRNLQVRLERHLEEAKISQAKAAPKIGVSSSVLSQYRRSIYNDGNIAEVEKKIEEWLDREVYQSEHLNNQKAYKAVTHGYVKTSISEDIYRRIRYCQMEKGMVILHGDAGVGKTKAAEKYAKENPNSILYIKLSPSSGSVFNSLKVIADALKVTESNNRYITSLRIKRALTASDKTLIIDEAQFLKLAALEELRSISDPDDILETQGTGIVLIGNSEVYRKMQGTKSASFAQLFSRIKMQKCYRTSDVKEDDIHMLFPYLTDQRMKKELNLLLSIARSNWGVRGAVNVYNNAVNNENISFEGLYGMAREMGIGVL